MGLFDRIKQGLGGQDSTKDSTNNDRVNQSNQSQINTLRWSIRAVNSEIYNKQIEIDAKYHVIQSTQESIEKLERLVTECEFGCDDYLFYKAEIDKKKSFIKEATENNRLKIPKLQEELKKLEDEKESFEKRLNELEN